MADKSNKELYCSFQIFVCISLKEWEYTRDNHILITDKNTSYCQNILISNKAKLNFFYVERSLNLFA